MKLTLNLIIGVWMQVIQAVWSGGAEYGEDTTFFTSGLETTFAQASTTYSGMDTTYPPASGDPLTSPATTDMITSPTGATGASTVTDFQSTNPSDISTALPIQSMAPPTSNTTSASNSSGNTTSSSSTSSGVFTTQFQTTDFPTTDSLTTDFPTTDSLTTDFPTTDSLTTDFPTTDSLTTDFPTTDSLTTDFPTTDSLTTDFPTTDSLTTDFPTTDSLTTDFPTTDSLTTDFPTTDSLTTDFPTTDSLTTDFPTTDSLTTDFPTTDSLTTYFSTTDSLTTDFPTTNSLTTDFPTTDPLTTDFSTTDSLTTDFPTTDSLTTDFPTTNTLTTDFPTTDPLTTDFSTTDSLTTDFPTTNSLTTDFPTTDPLTTDFSTTDSLTTDFSTNDSLTTDFPTTDSLTTDFPTTDPLTTDFPTTDSLTTDFPTTDPLTTDFSTTDSLTTDFPTTDSLTTHFPTTDSLTSDFPTTDSLTTHFPTTDPLTTDFSTTDSLTTDFPTTNSLTTDFPTTDPLTTDFSTTDSLTTDFPTTDSLTTDFPTTDSLTTDFSTTDPLTTDFPTTDSLTTDFPTTDSLTTDFPTTNSLTTDSPTTDSLTTDFPTTDSLTTDFPTTDSLTTEFPTTDSLTTDFPTTDPLTTDFSTTDSLTTDFPTTDPLTTDFSTTDSLTTDFPTTDSLTTDFSTTDSLTTDFPTTDSLTTDFPTTDPLTTDFPTTDSLTTDFPTTDSLTTDFPTTDSLTTDSSTPDSLTTDFPTTDSLTTDFPTTDPLTTDVPTSDPFTTTVPITDIFTTTTKQPTTAEPTTEQPTTAEPTTQATGCERAVCENGEGSCRDGVYSCACIPDYTGIRCEKYTPLTEGNAIDPSSEGSFSQTEDIIDKVSQTAEDTTDINVLKDTSEALKVLVDIASNASWTEQQIEKTGQDILTSTDKILTSVRELQRADQTESCVPDSTNPCKVGEKTEDVVAVATSNIVDLGSVVLKEKTDGVVFLQADNLQVTFLKTTSEDLADSRVENSPDVLLPSSLSDTFVDKSLILTRIDINKELYEHAANSINIPGSVVKVAMTTDQGEVVNNIDSDDAIIITVDARSNEPFNDLDLSLVESTLTAVQKVNPQAGRMIVVEFVIPEGGRIVMKGQFNELPRRFDRNFEVHVDGEIDVILSHGSIQFQMQDNNFVVINDNPSDSLYLVVEYTGTTGRRKREASTLGMRSRAINPKVWNSDTLTWEDNAHLAVVGVTEGGKLKFKSNFFGTFALSEILIPPTPIDFNRLFLNFETYIQDSPYVLAINCFLVVLTITVAIILRRVDIRDKELWRYYPLVGNPETNHYCYTLSIHTSIKSCRNLTATPCFILTGLLGNTPPLILADGCRKNFKPGTVSNFYMTSNVDLGELKRIKIWHDDHGSATNWHLDRIVMYDLQEKIRYLFLCQKWLALEKDDGKICRTFEAYSQNMEGISTLDIVSKQKLFDDHLWLSVFKRPTFSRFSRVQRFLCAVASLFLSMVTSAMWYQDYDSGTQKSRGITIGPVELNYRQLYVGVASAVIIMIPALLMTLTFRKRKLRGEHIDETGNAFGYFTGKKLLPWWCIFIGYFLVVTAVGASAFFTFLYSLQWGGTTSLNWLMSLVFCTTGSTFLVEPIKIVIMSMVLTTVFKATVQEEIGIVAPLERGSNFGVNSLVRPQASIPEPPDEENEEVMKRRKEMVLKNKLLGTGQSLGAHLAFVTMLAVICLHNEVTESFRLNKLVKGYANETYISKFVHEQGDIWTWLESVLIPHVLPKHDYTGELMSVYDQRFATDSVNYRTGPITLRQYRVRGRCPYNVMLHRYRISMRCLPEYSPSSEETEVFDTGWDVCRNLSMCTEKPYRPTSSLGGSSVSAQGTFGMYGDRSYMESWNRDKKYASSRAKFLKIHNWLDESTRALIVSVSFYNANVNLFTRLQVLFEMSTVGSVKFNVNASTARLYPYINVWDYLMLLLQVVFVLIVVVRLFRFIRALCCLKERPGCSTGFVFCVEMALSITATVVYGVKIDRTIFTVEELNNSPEEYVSFDLVLLLDDIFRFTISLVLFIRILCLMKPMTINYNLYVMRATLMKAQNELWGFSCILFIIVTAYVSFFYLLEGPTTFDIRSLPTTYMTLFESLLGLIRSRQLQLAVSGFESYTKQFMFVMFFFTVTMILMNIGISILNIDISTIKGHNKLHSDQSFDQELNDYLWKVLEKAVTSCAPVPRKTGVAEYANIPVPLRPFFACKTEKDDMGATDIGNKLDKMLSAITRSDNADVLLARNIANRALRDLCTAESRIRKTEEEVRVVQLELCFLKDAVRRLNSDTIKPEHHTSEPETDPVAEGITLSIDDRSCEATVTSNLDETTEKGVEVRDVTAEEMHVLTRSMRSLYSRVYKIKSTLIKTGNGIRLRLTMEKHPHPYENIVFAIREATAKRWKYIQGCNVESTNENTYIVECQCPVPEYIACVADPKTHVHTVTPSGGEFSLPFEPKARICYSRNAVKSSFDVTVKLIPWQPVPIVQITPGGNILSPINIQLPLSESKDSKPDWRLLCSTHDKQWWRGPSQVFTDQDVAVFVAYPGPANLSISFCLKVSEIHTDHGVSGEGPTEIVTEEMLKQVSTMMKGDWILLASMLGFGTAQITERRTDAHLSDSELCLHFLSRWFKQSPMAKDKFRTLRTAVEACSRDDVGRWLNQEYLRHMSSLADSRQGSRLTKAFLIAIKDDKLCREWRHLADTFNLSKEEITCIDSSRPRTNDEKAYHVLQTWRKRNPNCSLRDLQGKLQLAGYPVVAKKVLTTA